MKYRQLFAALFLLVGAVVLNAQPVTYPVNGVDDYRANAYRFEHATLHINAETTIEDGTLIIKDGRILYAGTQAAAPNNIALKVIDLKGKHIYPSLTEIHSDYGVNPKQSVGSFDESRPERPQFTTNKNGAYYWNQAIQPEIDANTLFQVHEAKAAPLRSLGFGQVLTFRKDGIVRGSGCAVMLGQESEHAMMLKERVSQHFSFDKGSSSQDYPSSQMGSIALLRQAYYDADWYKTQNAEKNISLERFNANRSLLQIFDAGDKLDVLRADKLGDEFGQQYIIKGSGDEYQRIDEIKNSKARLIVPVNFPGAFNVNDPLTADYVPLSSMMDWEQAPANLARLYAAGIEFCISSSDLAKPDQFFWKNLRKAIRYGLPEKEALKALTERPATWMGLEEEIGSLQSGKRANFLITSSGLFDEKNVIYENWINGKPYEVNSYDFVDIRGNYELLFNGQKYNFQISGDEKEPEAKIKIGEEKSKLMLERNGRNVSFGFNPEKDKTVNMYRFNGLISADGRQWNGRGQSPDGPWFDWKVLFVSLEADTATADSTKKVGEIGKIRYPFTGYGNEKLPQAEEVVFQNATVWTNEKEGILTGADVWISGGKIKAIGKDLAVPAGVMTFNLEGKHLTCGIIDEHSHIAISNGVNEGTQASSAEVRIGDVVNSEDINIYRNLAGGCVASQLLHGSANPIGGQSALIKLRWGFAPEQMKIASADGYIKFALGENVKQSNWGDYQTERYPQTRMGVEQVYYNYFTKAREYQDSWSKYQDLPAKTKSGAISPRRDLELDALSEILQKKRFITCHSYVQSEINMLMHVADSFGFKVNTFTHILEGYKVADKMKAHGASGSSFSDWWAYKMEVMEAIPYNAAILNEVGVNVAINSDDAEMSRRLNQEAAKSVKYGGMSEEDAWKLVTLNPAKCLHLDSHMGSIKAGKDADLVVWSDNPLSVYAKVEMTYVDGMRLFDLKQDQEKREWIAKERARLIQKMIQAKADGEPTQQAMKQDGRSYGCVESESGHVH